MRAPPSTPPSPRLLWVLPKWPLPAADGARVANVNLLRGLTALGVEIDAVAFAGPGEECDVEALKKTCRVASARLVRREATGLGLGGAGMLAALKHLASSPRLPVTLGPFAARGARAQLAALIAAGPPGGGRPWSAIVYDGLHPAAHSSAGGEFVPPGPPVLYRAHNVEAEIWERKAALTRLPPLRAFFRLQARLMRRFEASVVRAASAVLSVSARDFESFRAAAPGVKGGVVPIGCDFGDAAPPPPAAETFRLLFLAKLDWPPNRDGLVWFLDRVWGEARRRRPELELWVAGGGASEGLKRRLDAPGVRFFGRVETVDALYRDCALSIVPIFYGGGTRVKAIESSRFARPCLSTELGVEGLGLTAGETYFRAETAGEWIAALAGLERESAGRVGAAARERLRGAFHLPAAAAKFLENAAL